MSKDLVFLGRVRAKHHPAAMLRAFAKFKITSNDEQRQIHAEMYTTDRFSGGPKRDGRIGRRPSQGASR